MFKIRYLFPDVKTFFFTENKALNEANIKQHYMANLNSRCVFNT